MTMTKELELPRFKYIPNAYELGLFTKEEFTCDICKTEQNFRYTGPVYVENESSTGTHKVTTPKQKICPHCIESGKAADILNADFKDIDILEQACYNKEHIDEEKCESVIQTWLYQTPNFHGIETELWPICCSNFTAFIGYLGTGNENAQSLNLENITNPTELTAKLEETSVDELFQKLDKALDIEVKRLRKNGIKIKSGKELAEMLKKDEEGVVGYLFKCIECDAYRVHVDIAIKYYVFDI